MALNGVLRSLLAIVAGPEVSRDGGARQPARIARRSLRIFAGPMSAAVHDRGPCLQW